MALRRMASSLPSMSQAPVAMAMLCGEIILPPVAPVVLEAASQLLSLPVTPGTVVYPFMPDCPAMLAWSLPKSMLEGVSLPVTNVPMAPISGAKKG